MDVILHRKLLRWTFISLLIVGQNLAHAVDGVIEINQVRVMAGGITTGDTPGFPVTISSSGSYRLTGNLNAGPSSGVRISAPNVTLDLNGFSITGSTPDFFTDGVFLANNAENGEIRNGTISGFGRHGIFSLATFPQASGAPGVRVIDVRLLNNSRMGMNLEGQGHLVQDCSVSDNGSVGIRVLGRSVILNNVVRSNAGFGLATAAGVGYGMNVFADNNGGDANPQVNGAGVEIGVNVCGVNTTCP